MYLQNLIHSPIHFQVYSKVAKEGKFQTSLLERLFENRVTNVFLIYNYRTCQPLLEFVAETFYHERLTAKGQHPLHPRFYPLTFCAVSGEDQHIGMSYVNDLEVSPRPLPFLFAISKVQAAKALRKAS